MTVARIPSTDGALAWEWFVFENVDWAFYEMILRKLDGRNVRVTYDGKDLEIMSPLPEHELWKATVARLFEILTEQLNIPIVPRGSATLKRRGMRAGLEPDACYYVQNQALIRSAKQPNLRVDPPPDLAIEIDVTSRSVERQPIYAALHVPELWRYDGDNLAALELHPDGQYRPREFSVALPFLRVADLAPFVRKGADMDHTTLASEFRQWVVQNLAQHRRP